MATLATTRTTRQALPPQCRASVATALGECTGFVPAWPGFSSLRFAWGWLVVGLLGVVSAKRVSAFLAKEHIL